MIDEVSQATRLTAVPEWEADDAPPQPPGPQPSALGEDRGPSAEQIIRQRRSALDLDGKTSLSRSAFYRLLSRTVPQPGRFPFAVLPWSAACLVGHLRPPS